MVKQLTICLALLCGWAAGADYICGIGRSDSAELPMVSTDKMLYSQWHDCVLWMPFVAAGPAGTYYDYSGNEFDGSQTNPASRPTWGNGYYDFDGTNDIVSRIGIGLTTCSILTMSAWIKTSTNATMRIVSLTDRTLYSQPQCFIRVLATSQANVFMRGIDTENTSKNGAIVVTDNNWHHIVGVCAGSSGTIHLYVDSVDEGIASYGGAFTLDTFDATSVGGIDNVTEGQQFNGLIDDVRIYNRALTSNEVNAIWSDTKDDH